MNSTNTNLPTSLCFNVLLSSSHPRPFLVSKRSLFHLIPALLSGVWSRRMGRVTVNSKLTAVSSKPVRPGQTHKLSGLDHAMALHTIHVIFYYGNNPAPSFDLDPFRESLSEVLSMYPAVTGRLTRGEDGNWVVNCNDAGVRILRATVSATLDQWLRSADGAEERDLTVWEDMPQDPNIWSPFRIQMSEFEGGGVAIGLSCTHLHADPTGAALLLKSWAEAHRREVISHPPFFLSSAVQGRPVLNTKTKSANYYAAKSMAKPPSLKMATNTFRFSGSSIKQCLEALHESCPDATPFDLLAALFWTSLAPFKPPSPDQKHSLSICVDFRKLMHAPLPYGYFGNALHFSLMSLEKEEIDNGRLDHVTRLVHEHVSSINEEECQSAIDWLERQKTEGGKFRAPFRIYGPELTCVSMEHMIIPRGFEAMFKDAKPVHVACHVGNVEGDGLIMVLPSPEDGLARTVMVTLPEDQMAKLCKDPAILRLEPTFVGGGGQ